MPKEYLDLAKVVFQEVRDQKQASYIKDQEKVHDEINGLEVQMDNLVERLTATKCLLGH